MFLIQKQILAGRYVKENNALSLFNSNKLSTLVVFFKHATCALHVSGFESNYVFICSDLCFDGERPLPQPAQEVQRRYDGAQLMEVC